MYSNTKRYSESGWTKNIRSLLDKHFYTIQMQNREIEMEKKFTWFFQNSCRENLGTPSLTLWATRPSRPSCQASHELPDLFNYRFATSWDKYQSSVQQVSEQDSFDTKLFILYSYTKFNSRKKYFERLWSIWQFIKKKKGSLDFCK